MIDLGASVLCLGDSLTFGFGAGTGPTYPQWQEQLTGLVVHNAGANGDTSFHFQIIRMVVASPCRASALPAASGLDTNGLDTESQGALANCLSDLGIGGCKSTAAGYFSPRSYNTPESAPHHSK